MTASPTRPHPIAWLLASAAFVVALAAVSAITIYASAVSGPQLPPQTTDVILVSLALGALLCAGMAAVTWLDERSQRRAIDDDTAAIRRALTAPTTIQPILPAPPRPLPYSTVYMGAAVVVGRQEDRTHQIEIADAKTQGFGAGLFAQLDRNKADNKRDIEES